jgi:hypothetical protein
MLGSRVAIFSLMAAVFFSASARAVDPPLHAGGTFDPFLLALQPEVRMGALPPWVEGPAAVDASTATVTVSLQPDWLVGGVEMFVATIVFNDNGDGGPALEWESADGKVSTISYGLGEIGNPVGLNSRTVLLPQDLTRAGGKLLLSYFGKFDSLLSMAIRPAREDSMTVIGERHSPVLIDGNLQVFEDGEVNGTRPIPMAGDLRNGSIIEAELSARVEPLEDSLEFVIPIQGKPEAAMLRLESLGLDPESRIEVSLNGENLGTLAFPSFQLDDPSLVTDWNGNLILAGWRKGSLFIASRHLVEGDNSIVLTLKRSSAETGREVFLRNSGIHLRFSTPQWPQDFPPNPIESKVDGLSTAPDFSLVEPALPQAETTKQPATESPAPGTP